MSTSQQASSNLEFKALCALEKNDMAAILLRYDQLINTYKNKLGEISAAININSTEEQKTSALTQLNLWAKNTDKLDPFIGNYETKDAKKQKITNAFESRSPFQKRKSVHSNESHKQR